MPLNSVSHKTVLITRFPYEALLSGEEWHTITVAMELRQRGWEVLFMGSCPVLTVELEKRDFQVYRTWGGTLPVTKLALLGFLISWPFIMLSLIRQFSTIQKKHQIDALYMLSLTEKILMTPWLLYKKCTVLWVEHQRFGNWMYKNPLKVFYERWSKGVQIVGVSDMHIQQLEMLKIPSSHIHCITNGIDTEFFSPHVSPLVLEEGTFTIGTVARYYEDKGLDLLIKAFANVVRDTQQTNLRLVLMGEGPEESMLKDLSKQYEVDTYIEFIKPYTLVPREQMPAFYRGLDIFVLASRKHDPFGLVAAEAMSVGVPTIVTDVCGISTQVKDGEDALVIEAGSVSALEKALIELSDSIDLREKIGTGGRKKVVNRFSLKRMVDEYEEFLKK